VVDLAEVKRDSGFEISPQAQRELEGRSIPTEEILKEVRRFQNAWWGGVRPQALNATFRFQKVHDAECAQREILLYEIYVQRGKHRAVVAWIDSSGPGYWVSFFKKQGNPQSKASLRTAGERAMSIWRATHE
jgi:hypothetical protein